MKNWQAFAICGALLTVQLGSVMKFSEWMTTEKGKETDGRFEKNVTHK